MESSNNVLATSSFNQPEKKPQPTEKHVNKVTTGGVVVRKPSVGKKVLAEFLEQDANDIKEYVWKDVMIPTIKETLCNIVELLLFGSTSRGKNRNRNNQDNHTSYSSYYYSSGRNNSRREHEKSNAPRNFNEIIFATRMDCEEVIAALNDILDRYDSVSISDLYDAIGVTGEYVDNKWGWKRGSQFYVRRVRDGYSIDMPKPTLLE